MLWPSMRCAGVGEKQACRTMVGLLVVAHERTCAAELDIVIATELGAGRLPDLKVLAERFKPSTDAVPVVVVNLPSSAIYDQIAAFRGGTA
jgi:hypothetical protein